MWGDITIVKGVIRKAKFAGDFEKNRHPSLGQFDASFSGVPRANGGRAAKHVRALATHGVPVDDGESEVLSHRLSFDHFACLVVPIGEGIF